MNKILISFLSLVMFINPNTSYSSIEFGVNHEEIINIENYKLPNQVGYIHTLENLQTRLEDVQDLNLDMSSIGDKITILKNDLRRNNNIFFNRLTINYIRNKVIPDLNLSLNRAQQQNKQEKAQIIEELIGIYSSVANDIEHLENQ